MDLCECVSHVSTCPDCMTCSSQERMPFLPDVYPFPPVTLIEDCVWDKPFETTLR